MSQNSYTSLDHADIMDSLVLYLKSQDEFKDYNFDGSVIRELLRILAYNTQQQAFQNNFLYNELQLDSAQLRPNVVSLANKLGYTPRSKTCSKLVVNLTVTPADVSVAPNNIKLARDTIFYSNANGKFYQFVPDKVYNAYLSGGKYYFTNVTLVQGTWQSSSFTVSTMYGFENYQIPNKNIDTNTLEVYVRSSDSVNNVLYKKYTSAYDLGSTQNLYFLNEDRDGYYNIKFGDDILSNKPNYSDVVTVKYLVTDGLEANNISKLSLGSSIDGYYDVVIAPYDSDTPASSGGADEETLDSIRTYAPLVFAASGNAVVASDYVSIIRSIRPDIDSAIAWDGSENDPPKHGYVYVAVKKSNYSDPNLSTSDKAGLVTTLKKYNVGSITPILVDPDYIYLNLVSTVKYDPYKLSITTSSLETKITDYTTHIYSDKYLNKFDSEYDMNHASDYINSVDESIISNITQTNYEKRFSPIINQYNTAILKFNRSVLKGSLYISGFNLSDDSVSGYTYYAYDLDGKIYLAKTDGTNITKMNGGDSIGTIDYVTGELLITGFRPNYVLNSGVVSTLGYVTVTVSPDTFDHSLKPIRGCVLRISSIDITLKAKE